MILVLDVVRLIFLGAVLGFASYQDLTRNVTVKHERLGVFTAGKVSNRLWLFALPVGVLFTVVDLIFYPVLLVLVGVSLLFTVVLSLVLFRFGGWGGADVKAFVTVGVAAPLVPVWSIFFPLPLPFFVIFISSGLAVLYGMLKRSEVPFGRRTVRFLPFMFVGLLVTMIL